MLVAVLLQLGRCDIRELIVCSFVLLSYSTLQGRQGYLYSPTGHHCPDKKAWSVLPIYFIMLSAGKPSCSSASGVCARARVCVAVRVVVVVHTAQKKMCRFRRPALSLLWSSVPAAPHRMNPKAAGLIFSHRAAAVGVVMVVVVVVVAPFRHSTSNTTSSSSSSPLLSL